MNAKTILYAGVAILVSLSLLGCLVYALDIIPRTVPIHWEMQAYEVAENGNVLENHTVTIEGKLLYYRKKDNYLVADIDFSDSYPYSVFMPNDGYSQYFLGFEEMGIFYTTCYGYNTAHSVSESFSFALDPQAGCFIIRLRKSLKYPDAPRPYLVASVDPTATSQEIMDHFPWFPDYS